jgi:transcription elongation factor Elf1
MEQFESVACPFCGQLSEVAVNVSLAHQRFITDCEVCCRPFEVIVDCENGEITSLDTVAN